MLQVLPEARTSAASSEITVEFISDVAEIECLGPIWEEFNCRGGDHASAFFQSHAWSVHAARIRATRSAQRVTVCVAKVLRGDTTIGFWPLSVHTVASARIARCLDDPFGQFAGVVFADPGDIRQGVSAVLRTLRSKDLADAIQIEGVVAGSAFHKALVAEGMACGNDNPSVVVDMRGHADHATWQRTLNKKTMMNLRNAHHRMERFGEVKKIETADPVVVGEIIAESFAGRLAWLNKSGRTSTAFRDPDFRPFVAGLTEAPKVGLLAFKLDLAGVTIADMWGFEYDNVYYAYISSRHPDYDRFSPGRVHMGQILKACYERGLTVVELMPPVSSYKMNWTDKTKLLCCCSRAFTARGHVVLAWLQRVRPALVGVARRRLPPGVRSRLANLANA